MNIDSEPILADMLYVTASWCVRMARFNHSAPRGKEILKRMGRPKVGDLVVVDPVLGAGGDEWRRVGILTLVTGEPGDRAYTLWHPIMEQPTRSIWSNVGATAVPVAMRAYDTSTPGVDGLFLADARLDFLPESMRGLKRMSMKVAR